VRAIQALLETDEPSQISGLAAQVKLSLAQTHTVLEALEEAGLVRSIASGPARRRTVPDRGALLDWLAAQPSARRREPRIDAYVYARRSEELWRNISQKLDAAGIAHALTGAAGAALYGVGPTAVPVTLLRATSDVSLEDVAMALVADPTERGANVRLIRDTGQVGCMGAARRDGVSVAPRVRIYLDALSEKRGEDLAQQFREVCLGY
jgi:DNA-binding IclR family transcriptional regulator